MKRIAVVAVIALSFFAGRWSNPSSPSTYFPTPVIFTPTSVRKGDRVVIVYTSTTPSECEWHPTHSFTINHTVHTFGDPATLYFSSAQTPPKSRTDPNTETPTIGWK